MHQDHDTGQGYTKYGRGTHEASVSYTIFMRDIYAREAA